MAWCSASQILFAIPFRLLDFRIQEQFLHAFVIAHQEPIDHHFVDCNSAIQQDDLGPMNSLLRKGFDVIQT